MDPKAQGVFPFDSDGSKGPRAKLTISVRTSTEGFPKTVDRPVSIPSRIFTNGAQSGTYQAKYKCEILLDQLL